MNQAREEACVASSVNDDPPASQSVRNAPPSLDRAMDALEWAAGVAESRELLASDGSAPVSVDAEDVKAAAKLDPAAVRARLDRVMMGTDPEAGLDALLASGALVGIFPEVHALVGFGDGEFRHKDVWKHTKQVVRQAVPRLEVRWASLFHDIGKVKTRSFTPDGKVQFLGHAEVGTRMFDKLDRRLALFSPEAALKGSVRFLVLHHLRAAQYDASWTDAAVRRFGKEMGDHLQDLLDLSRADITTKRPEKKRRGLLQIEELACRIQTIVDADAVIPPLPSGIGDAVMAAFGIPPSRKIGEIKKALEAAIDAGDVQSHQPTEYYLEILSADRARYEL